MTCTYCNYFWASLSEHVHVFAFAELMACIVIKKSSDSDIVSSHYS